MCGKWVVGVVLAVSPYFSTAQFSRPEVEFNDDESYLYPIRPGQPGSLAGTMGELRSTHFHTGIDIRTDNTIGLPVLASKSGYVSRVSISPTGYGNAIYIKHPDGNTTVYAHLDRFMEPLAEYVLKEQYRRKTGSINLFFRKDQFPVKRGDTIALSGNSGSSAGPHLHFDIRDPDNLALNPLMVAGFSEIVDNLPPSVEKVALRTLDKNSRINDRFGRFEFHARRVGNDFVFPTPIMASGSIGVEILAKDRLAPGSRFSGGVNYIEMYVDSQLVFNQSIDKLNFAQARGVYTVMDFKTLRHSGSRFYKLYLDDGNNLRFYEKSPGNGKIRLQPGQDSNVLIVMRDSYGNTSTISFRLLSTPLVKEVNLLTPARSGAEYDVQENILVLKANSCLPGSTDATLYSKKGSRPLEPDYYSDLCSVYLIDLREEIPDSVVVCGQSIKPGIVAAVPHNLKYHYYSDLMDIIFQENAAYDTVYLQTGYRILPDNTVVYSIGSPAIPLNKSIKVTLKPVLPVTWNKRKAVYLKEGKGFSYLGGNWHNGGIHFDTRDFGEFVVLEDTVPPTIRPISMNSSGVRFRINDDLSGIANFEARINGEWLLMLYDSKTGTIWSERLDKTKPLKGNLTLVVTDRSNNEAMFTHTFP